MSRTGTVAAATVTAGAFVVGGVTARVLDNHKRRRRKKLRDENAPFGSVHGELLTVIADDGLSLRAEIDDVPDDGSGPTVVFLHGWMLNMNEWHYQRLALRSQYRMVFLDHRGHGQSANPEPETCTLRQLADDVATTINQLVPDGQIILVGHSMGGMTIMSLAQQYPELFIDRVDGVVLCGTSAGKVIGRYLPIAGLGRLIRLFRPVLDGGRRFNSYSVIKRWGLGPKAEAVHVDMTDEMMMSTSSKVLADYSANFVDLNLFDALPIMGKVPVCVVSGTKDRVTPIHHARTLVDHIDSATLTEVKDAGHMVVFEGHEVVSEAIAQIAATRQKKTNV